MPPQGAAHRGLLSAEQGLIETTNGLECSPGAEEKTPARYPSDAVERDRDTL
jgi:hypothetical protein